MHKAPRMPRTPETIVMEGLIAEANELRAEVERLRKELARIYDAHAISGNHALLMRTMAFDALKSVQNGGRPEEPRGIRDSCATCTHEPDREPCRAAGRCLRYQERTSPSTAQEPSA